MKPVHNSRNGTAWCLLWMLLWAVPAFAAELTALALIQESNQHVGAEARDQVLQLRSEKSVAGLTPRIWYVLHYDRAATMRATEVKFGGGEMLQVARPISLFKRPDASAVLDRSKLKIDSDDALKIARKERLLNKLTLTNSRMVLEQWESAPVWKIEFWAEKTRDKTRTVEIGSIFVSAETGRIVNRDLHIERVE